MRDRVRIVVLVLALGIGAAVAWGAWWDGFGRQLDRAGALAFKERWAEAAAAYRAIIASADPVEEREVWLEAHARLADVTWMGLSDERGAAEIYRAMIERAPRAEQSWIARERLAEIADRHFGDVHEAIAHWQALAGSGRPNAQAFAWKVAKAYFRIGDYDQVRQECESIVHRWPDGEFADDAMLLIGTAWQFEGRHEEAIAAFEAAEARFAGTETAARARYQIGQSRASLRDWEGAQAALLEALETHPDPFRVQADLARVQKHLAEQREGLREVGRFR